MDGTAITTALTLISGEGLDLLCILGLAWVIFNQRQHEKHCRERHRAHYDAERDLGEPVSRLEGQHKAA